MREREREREREHFEQAGEVKKLMIMMMMMILYNEGTKGDSLKEFGKSDMNKYLIKYPIFLLVLTIVHNY